MRQAHPRNRTRHRILAAGLTLAIGGTAVLALATLASGGAPSGAAGSAVGGGSASTTVASTAAVERTSRVEPEAGRGGGPVRSALSLPPRIDDLPPRIDETPARAAVDGRRPQIALPDVAPRIVPRAPAGSRAVVLGDSYTSGWNGAGLGSRNWTSIVGKRRGWTIVNLAVPGTGFLNPGWTNQPVGSRVAAVVRQRPDVVIVASGHNDSRWSGAATSRAAERVIDRLRAALPDAVLVIVAPIWQNGSPPARCLVLRDHLRRKAVAIGAVFIDPLAEGWYAGANDRYIGPDGLHPTNAGHRHMAGRVLADLADRLAA